MKAAPGATRRSLAERLVGGPVGFRQYLERRGPVFVKIGQFLALRPDLIPQPYCDELMRLFEQVKTFPWPDARRIIREDLGAEPADLFGYFDTVPIAAGSLAQTYYARLHDGTPVAVKVLRPNIGEQVRKDLRLARRLARLLEMSRAQLIVSPRDALDEVSSWLLEELDLGREAANIRRLRRLAASSPFQIVPRVYLNRSGARVVTTRYIEGVHVTALLADEKTGGADDEDAPATDVDRERFGENLIKACLTQIFTFRFFHADLHPGNLIVVGRSCVGFVDFGLCEELDETVRAHQIRYLSALYGGDNDEVFRALLEVLVPTDAANVEAFRSDFSSAVRTWSHQSLEDGRPVTDGAYTSPVAVYMIAVMRAARVNGFRIPPGILALYRALLTAESVAHQLQSHADLRGVGRQFFKELRSASLVSMLEPQNVEATILNYLTLWRESPGQVNQILADLADYRFALKVSTTEHADLRRAWNRRTRLLATAIASVSVAVLLAVQVSRPGPLWGVWLTGTILSAVYLYLFWQYRRLK